MDSKKSKSELQQLAVVGPIDRTVDIAHRPMGGFDVEGFRARHRLLINDAIYALCIQNSAKFNKVCCLSVLPFTLEFLIRLYDEYPCHAEWKDVSPNMVFNVLYGSVLEDFADRPEAKDVRLALYRRFMGLLGRAIFTAYRWIEGKGDTRSLVKKIFVKALSTKDPRKTLESIAIVMYRTRGQNFNTMFPMPSLKHPPVHKQRGPVVGSVRKSMSSGKQQTPEDVSQAVLVSQTAAEKSGEGAKRLSTATPAARLNKKKFPKPAKQLQTTAETVQRPHSLRTADRSM